MVHDSCRLRLLSIVGECSLFCPKEGDRELQEHYQHVVEHDFELEHVIKGEREREQEVTKSLDRDLPFASLERERL